MSHQSDFAFMWDDGTVTPSEYRREPPPAASSDAWPAVELPAADADWTAEAACRVADGDWFSHDVVAIAAAKLVCVACPVSDECLEWALDMPERHGVWGGLTPTERDGLRGRVASNRVPPSRRRPVPLPAGVAHGTSGAYARHGCRCDVCARYKRDQKREHKC